MTGDNYKIMPLIRRRSDGYLYELTPAQKKACDELCRKECCNYYRGNCLLLEDVGGDCPCVQSISYHATCCWFQDAVLPLNWKLESEIFRDENTRICENCGVRFRDKAAHVKYCPDCRALVRRKKKREYEQNRRDRIRGIGMGI